MGGGWPKHGRDGATGGGAADRTGAAHLLILLRGWLRRGGRQRGWLWGAGCGRRPPPGQDSTPGSCAAAVQAGYGGSVGCREGAVARASDSAASCGARDGGRRAQSGCDGAVSTTVLLEARLRRPPPGSVEMEGTTSPSLTVDAALSPMFTAPAAPIAALRADSWRAGRTLRQLP